MVGDGRLGEAERLGQVTDARLTRRLGLDEAQEAEARGICEDSECPGQVLGLGRVEGAGQERRARRGERGDRFHQMDIDSDR
jgi:hypothetical protein